MARSRYGYLQREDAPTRLVPGGDPVAPDSSVNDPLSGGARLVARAAKDREVGPTLPDFKLKTDSAASRIYSWGADAFTAEVWVGIMTFPLYPDNPWDEVRGTMLPLDAGALEYEIPKPAKGYVTFVQIEARAHDLTVGDVWQIEVNAAAPNVVYNQTLAQIIAADDLTVTVQVTSTAVEGLPTVQLVAITGSATLNAGPAIGVDSPSGTIWVFNRGAPLGGPGEAQFRGTYPGNEDDDDFVTIAEQGRDTVAVVARARVIAVAPTTVTVRVAVADPYPQGANSATIAYVEHNTGAATAPVSPQNVTPAATLTEAAGTYVDFVITRPPFGTGAGRVTFTATAGARVTDSDAVDVPEANRDTVYLQARARVIAVAPTTVTVRVAVADPYPQGANSATIAYQDQGSGGVAPGSGGTVTPAATLTEAAGTFIDYVITRPAFGVGAGRVTFTVTAANRGSDSDAVDVPEANRDTQGLSIRILRVSETAQQLVVRIEVISPNAAAVVTIAYDNAGLTVAPASGGTLNSTSDFATTNHIDYTITRDAIGGTPRRVTFTASAPGFVDVTDGVDVPPETSGFAAKVHNSVNQAIPNASGGTLLTWDTEDYDSGALHDLVTNPGRFTIPAGGDKGVWMFEAQGGWGDNGVGFRMLLIFKNGSEVARVEDPGLATGFGHSTCQQVRFTDRAPVVGDYYEVFGNQNSGGALNILTAISWFAVTHVQS